MKHLLTGVFATLALALVIGDSRGDGKMSPRSSGPSRTPSSSGSTPRVHNPSMPSTQPRTNTGPTFVPRIGDPVGPRFYPADPGTRIYVGPGSSGSGTPSSPRVTGSVGQVDDDPVERVAAKTGSVPDDDPLANLNKQQKEGLKRIVDVLTKKKDAISDRKKMKPNALFELSDGQQQQLTNFLDPNVNPGANNLSETQKNVIQKIANNDLPLTPEEMAIAIGVLGQPNVGMNSATADAIGQGLIDSLAANLPPAAAQQPLGQAIVDMINQALQGALGGLAGGGGGGGGDPGVAVGPADAPADGLPPPNVAAPNGGVQNAGAPLKSDTAPAAVLRHDRRYLRVKNETESKLTVYVQYETMTDEGKWIWFPGTPEKKQAIIFPLAAGGQAEVDDDNFPINARRVRIWATAADGKRLADYRNRDLWLVQENEGPNRTYAAPSAETYTYTFKK